MSASALLRVGLPVRLLLRPARAGDEEELRVRTDGLLARARARGGRRPSCGRALGDDGQPLHGRRGAALQAAAAAYAPGSTRSTQGRSFRRSFASMRCL